MRRDRPACPEGYTHGDLTVEPHPAVTRGTGDADLSTWALRDPLRPRSKGYTVGHKKIVDEVMPHIGRNVSLHFHDTYGMAVATRPPDYGIGSLIRPQGDSSAVLTHLVPPATSQRKMSSMR